MSSESQARPAKPLSRSLKTFFGIGDFGFTLMTNIDTFYASYFFINIALLPLATVSIITTISAVIDLTLSCLYGAWMNKIKPGKWGRYRSWLVLTPWLVPFLYMFEFVKLSNPTVMVVVMTIAMTDPTNMRTISIVKNAANTKPRNAIVRIAAVTRLSFFDGVLVMGGILSTWNCQWEMANAVCRRAASIAICNYPFPI